MPMMPTYDFETEADAIKRKQAIADAMQQSALAPLQLPTQPGVKLSGVNVLAKLLEGYVAGKKSDEAKADRAALSQRYGDELKSGMEQYYKTMQGYEAPSMALAPHEDGTPQMVKVPGDPRKAVMEALASNHPVLRELAMSQLKEMDKPTELKEVGGVVYDPKTREMVRLGGAAPERKTVNGDLYEMNPSTGQWKKLDNGTKISLSNIGNPVVKGQNAGIEAWSKEAAATVSELATSARQSVKLKSQLNQLEALTQGGTAAGPMADAIVFLDGLAKQAGIPVNPTKLNNSQTFNSVATQAWAALMQQNGGARGLVKEESEKLAQSLPALTQRPEGRAQIIAVLRQAADQNIADAATASKQYARALQTGNLEEFTYGLSATQLPQSSATPPAVGGVAPGSPKRVRLEDM